MIFDIKIKDEVLSSELPSWVRKDYTYPVYGVTSKGFVIMNPKTKLFDTIPINFCKLWNDGDSIYED